MAILNKGFGKTSGPSNMPDKVNIKNQSQKKGTPYGFPYKQEFNTGPLIGMGKLQAAGKEKELPEISQFMEKGNVYSPSQKGTHSASLEIMKLYKNKVYPANQGAKKEDEKKEFIKRAEIKKEMRKQAMGVTLDEKMKAVPQKAGDFISKTEIKRAEKSLHSQYLKTADPIKRGAISGEAGVLKKLEKKLK